MAADLGAHARACDVDIPRVLGVYTSKEAVVPGCHQSAALIYGSRSPNKVGPSSSYSPPSLSSSSSSSSSFNVDQK